MRLSITFIFLSCISLAMAQGYGSGSKIDEDSKRRLENQFKALNTFYINDEGLVVYQNKGNGVSVVEEYDEESFSNEQPTAKPAEKEYREESIPASPAETPSVSREGVPVRTRPVISKNRNVSNASSYNSGNREQEVVRPPVTDTRNEPAPASTTRRRPASVSKRPVNPVYVNKSATVPSVNRNTDTTPKEVTYDVAESVTIPEEVVDVPPAPVTTSRPPMALENILADKEEVPADTVPARPSIFSKKSVFGSEPSKYKDLEEAAWAAQELLEKLRSEHPKAKNSGSLSSSISRGAGRASLRKRNSSSGNMAVNSRTRATTGNNRPVISEETREAEIRYERAANEQPVEGEPTYFLNGIQVDKSVINKLKGSDILRKERRVRNTVSGNPVGEIWYEVK